MQEMRWGSEAFERSVSDELRDETGQDRGKSDDEHMYLIETCPHGNFPCNNS